MKLKSLILIIAISLYIIFQTFTIKPIFAESPRMSAVPLPQHSVQASVNDTTKLNQIIKKNIESLKSEPSALAESKQFAKSKKLNHFLAYKLFILAQNQRLIGNYQIGHNLDIEALELANKLNDKTLLANIYIDMAVSYRKTHKNEKAIEYSRKALAYASAVNDSTNMSIAINNIGNAYLQLKQYATALQFFKHSLKLEQTRKNMTGIAINLNNIGKVYLDKSNFSRAINYFSLSLEINKQMNLYRGMAICNTDLAHTFEKEGNFIKAQEHAKSALQQFLQSGSRKEISEAYIKLGVLNNKNGQIQHAIVNLKEGIKLSKGNDEIPNLVMAYLTLYNIYKAKQDFQKALHYNMLANLYEDSLSNLNLNSHFINNKASTSTIQEPLTDKAYNKYFSDGQQSWNKILLIIIFIFTVSIFALSWLFWFIKRRNTELSLKNSEIERINSELKQKSEALIKARQEAEKTASTKNRFLAHISHEIRTPLNSVLGFAELLKQSQTGGAQQYYLNSINSAGKSLLNLLNNILDFAKYDNENLSFKTEEINIREVIDESVNIFALKASEKKLQLLTDVQTSISNIILFNKMVLQQTLLNLVGNAIKYTQKGHITIKLTQEKGNKKNLLNLIICVEDTGIGIPEDQINNIFEPFYQANNFSESEGAGLGLSITQQLVSKMNGNIEVRNNPVSGTSFIIRFYDIPFLETSAHDVSHSKIIYKANKTKLLFINVKSNKTEDLVNSFEMQEFDVIDVGLGMTEAKKYIESVPLIVLCCLNKEETENTLNIIENISIKNNQKILIIQNHQLSSEHNVSNTKVINLEREDFKENLFNFINEFKENDNLDLFESQAQNISLDEIISDLNHIFRNCFENAYNSRILDEIESLCYQLDNIAGKYEMPHLNIFVREMQNNIKEFDISALDKQLELLKKQLSSTTGK
ncbi:MAG: tetratricopeptide repeat protein [Bacteroidales bacterium]|nr:tetratricopeptide repeat protein [Bacteroidales bacterium]